MKCEVAETAQRAILTSILRQIDVNILTLRKGWKCRIFWCLSKKRRRTIHHLPQLNAMCRRFRLSAMLNSPYTLQPVVAEGQWFWGGWGRKFGVKGEVPLQKIMGFGPFTAYGQFCYFSWFLTFFILSSLSYFFLPPGIVGVGMSPSLKILEGKHPQPCPSPTPPHPLLVHPTEI